MFLTCSGGSVASNQWKHTEEEERVSIDLSVTQLSSTRLQEEFLLNVNELASVGPAAFPSKPPSIVTIDPREVSFPGYQPTSCSDEVISVFGLHSACRALGGLLNHPWEQSEQGGHWFSGVTGLISLQSDSVLSTVDPGDFPPSTQPSAHHTPEGQTSPPLIDSVHSSSERVGLRHTESPPVFISTGHPSGFT
ncbi:unnamed protein product [Pleuronectes platessa]|uniref:Uncharacterized protein n=1 Tax=Pleuronectes platessa TaxID=8262 RepID=A0A9N7V1M5_PLEPL|nr:unnamed protein product [Pleuronectes platessa]